LFGIANQLLAAIALCLATTILFKDANFKDRPAARAASASAIRAQFTLIPLAWLLGGGR